MRVIVREGTVQNAVWWKDGNEHLPRSEKRIVWQRDTFLKR